MNTKMNYSALSHKMSIIIIYSLKYKRKFATKINVPFSIQDNTNLINYTSLHLLYKKKIMKLRENVFCEQLTKKHKI